MEGESAHGYWRCLHNIAACTILLSDVNEKIKCTAFDSFEHRKIELTSRDDLKGWIKITTLNPKQH